MNVSDLIKRAARHAMMIVDPSAAVLGSGNTKNTPLLVAIVVCILAFAVAAIAVQIPIAYFTR